MSVPAPVESVAAPDSIDYQDSAYGVGNGVVVDAEHVEDKEESYTEIHNHHQNTESEPASLRSAIVFITIHNFDFYGLESGLRLRLLRMAFNANPGRTAKPSLYKINNSHRAMFSI